jgi:hypothetical protein
MFLLSSIVTENKPCMIIQVKAQKFPKCKYSIFVEEKYYESVAFRLQFRCKEHKAVEISQHELLLAHSFPLLEVEERGAKEATER